MSDRPALCFDLSALMVSDRTHFHTAEQPCAVASDLLASVVYTCTLWFSSCLCGLSEASETGSSLEKGRLGAANAADHCTRSSAFRITMVLRPAAAAARVAAPSLLLFLVMLVAVVPEVVQSAPYLLLQNKAPKCFQIDAPQNKKLVVKYHAPGASAAAYNAVLHLVTAVHIPCDVVAAVVFAYH